MKKRVNVYFSRDHWYTSDLNMRMTVGIHRTWVAAIAHAVVYVKG
jgi:hypothetical protein